MLTIPAAVGEVADKLTILQIKRERVRDPDQLAYVVREQDLLQTALAPLRRAYPRLEAMLSDLLAVNLALWDLEDLVRRDQAEEDLLAYFKYIRDLNDDRARAKLAINVLTASQLREVKQHA